LRELGQIILRQQANNKTLWRKIHMPNAFVLINTEIGSEGEVLEKLEKVEGVRESYLVYGVYDIVARIEAKTMDKLKEIVTWNVRRLDKVRSTLTMIVVEEPK
jgi:DNA-binding Lrp family transcriptional regulator